MELRAKRLLLGALDTLLLWAGWRQGSGIQKQAERAHHVLLRAKGLLLGALDALLLLRHGQALLLHVLLHRRAHRARRVDALLVVLQQLPAGHAPVHPQENLYA